MRATVYLHAEATNSEPAVRIGRVSDGRRYLSADFGDVVVTLPDWDLAAVTYARALGERLLGVARELDATLTDEAEAAAARSLKEHEASLHPKERVL